MVVWPSAPRAGARTSGAGSPATSPPSANSAYRFDGGLVVRIELDEDFESLTGKLGIVR
jgi:hypothetical protein